MGDWKEAKDSTGRVYYYHTVTKQTSWIPPPSIAQVPLPAGWTQHAAPGTGIPYYFNAQTGETTQTRPVVKAVSKARVKIPGTPFLFVRASDGRTFFYNSEEKKSYWTKPDFLKDVEIPALPGPAGVSNKHARESEQAEDEIREIKRVRKEEENLSVREIAQRAATDADRGRIADEQADRERRERELELERQAAEIQAEMFGGFDDEVVEQVEIEQPPQQQQQQFAIQNLRPPSYNSAVFENHPVLAVSAEEDRYAAYERLLEESKVSAFGTWETEKAKFDKDPRFLALSKKDRKEKFDGFLALRAEKERKERAAKLLKARSGFHDLMEDVKITKTTTFQAFCDANKKDPRFLAIEKRKEKLKHFNDFKAELKAGKGGAASTEGFTRMLKECKELTYKSRFSDAERALSSDKRWKAVRSSQRERLFDSFVRSIDPYEKAKQQKLREQRSLRKREDEVRCGLSQNYQEAREQKKKFHRVEGTAEFMSLMVDYIKSASLSWDQAYEILRTDSRWKIARQVPEDKRIDLYEKHIEKFQDRQRAAFTDLIDNNESITFSTPWEEAQPVLATDPKYGQFGKDDAERERLYNHHQNKMIEVAERHLKELLTETRCITNESWDKVSSNKGSHMAEVIEALQHDKRFLDLECVPQRRSVILLNYMQALDQQGERPAATANPMAHAEYEARAAEKTNLVSHN